MNKPMKYDRDIDMQYRFPAIIRAGQLMALDMGVVQLGTGLEEGTVTKRLCAWLREYTKDTVWLLKIDRWLGGLSQTRLWPLRQ